MVDHEFDPSINFATDFPPSTTTYDSNFSFEGEYLKRTIQQAKLEEQWDSKLARLRSINYDKLDQVRHLLNYTSKSQLHLKVNNQDELMQDEDFDLDHLQDMAIQDHINDDIPPLVPRDDDSKTSEQELQDDSFFLVDSIPELFLNTTLLSDIIDDEDDSEYVIIMNETTQSPPKQDLEKPPISSITLGRPPKSLQTMKSYALTLGGHQVM